MFGEHAYGFAAALGILLVIAWVAAVCIALLCQSVWNWIDDGARPITHNPVMRRVMAWLGYSPYDGGYWYMRLRDRHLADGILAFFTVLGSCLALPICIVAALDFYPVTLTAFTLYLLAHSARFSRRLLKRLDKHLADPHAHKESHE